MGFVRPCRYGVGMVNRMSGMDVMVGDVHIMGSGCSGGGIGGEVIGGSFSLLK